MLYFKSLEWGRFIVFVLCIMFFCVVLWVGGVMQAMFAQLPAMVSRDVNLGDDNHDAHDAHDDSDDNHDDHDDNDN